jgi:tRNA 5-methylaminomethyl-2-thiouridine biosynthesis bifunctional protein
MRKVEPVELEFDAAGAPYSRRYGDVYASRDGAAGQARHVFLGGNDLPARWAGRGQFVVLETGFGLATNFLATWQAWRDDPARPRRLHFVSVERHPLAAADLLRAAPAELTSLAAQLAEQWPLPLPGLHRLAFEGERVVLTLALGDAADLVPKLALGADAFYLDGFAPERNPEMWSPPLLRALARLARPGARLATWCTARAVRDALAESGFTIERRAGFGHKREMLAARFEPRWKVRRHEPPRPYAGERQAVVVGAGLAGCAVAQALARRGWQVDVLDAAEAPASGASALPWGLLHAQISPDDNLLARLTRAGFLLGRQQLMQTPDDHGVPVWQPCGVLQQASDDAEALAMQRAAVQFGMTPQFAQWLDGESAVQRAGMALHRGGLWFGSGGVVSSRRWCRAMLDGHQARITLRAPARAARLAQDGDGWRVEDGSGGVLGAAPVLIVAAALASPALIGLHCAPVRPVRGRITLLRDGDLAPLRVGLAGDGYVVRGPDGSAGVGASYEFAPAEGGDSGEVSLEDIHRGNLQRLGRLLVDPGPVAVSGVFDGVRCVAHDRLPLAGAVADEAAATAQASRLRGAHPADLPRRAGLFASFALGSRGLALAPLAGELIAAQLEGEPWPVEGDLAAAIDPARFLLRRLRSGGPV